MSDIIPMAETNAAKERALARELAELPADVSPGKDLWPLIRSKISQQQGPETTAYASRWLPRALAASLVVAVVAGLLMARAPTPAPGMADSTWQALEQDFLEARQTWLQVLEARRDNLDPGFLATVDGHRLLLGQAEADLKAALMRDPGNMEYARLLVMTYRQELEILSQLDKVPDMIPQGEA